MGRGLTHKIRGLPSKGPPCSAYPTIVGGPGVYRAYECWARRARPIGRGSRAAIDGVTGELSQTKLTPAYEHIRSWIGERWTRRLPVIWSVPVRTAVVT